MNTEVLSLYSSARMNPRSHSIPFYSKIARKKGKQKAVVAAASKLLKVVYWVMKECRKYHG